MQAAKAPVCLTSCACPAGTPFEQQINGWTQQRLACNGWCNNMSCVAVFAADNAQQQHENMAKQYNCTAAASQHDKKAQNHIRT
jgi:hypothetical protein